MKSIERQLQKSLAIILLLILLGLLLIANQSTRSLLEEFVTTRLEHDAIRILNNFGSRSGVDKVRWRRINPVYNSPDSGHYYAIKIISGNSDADELIIRSPSLQQHNLPLPDGEKSTTLHDVSGPQSQRLIIWSKVYNKNGKKMIISIAEDMSLLIKKRQHFALLFIVMGVIGFLLMLLALRLVIRRLFKHLDNSRQEIKQIATGDRQQLSEYVPIEIYPLVKEFNHSLSLMQQRMERSRNSLGNLAHALKTPLSLLMQQLDRGTTELDSAKKQAERIRQLTERELKRARLAGLGNTTQRFDPDAELPTLIDVLKQAHRKEALEVKLDIADTIDAFGDREDMLELLGNLMDNAFKWAKSEIVCAITSSKTNITIRIEDDGAGQILEELEQLTQRGTRLDESVKGHGLGLAICKDIVKLYAGSIRFDRSKNLGGFLVEIKLPK